jgi:hypothetical protein
MEIKPRACDQSHVPSHPFGISKAAFCELEPQSSPPFDSKKKSHQSSDWSDECHEEWVTSDGTNDLACAPTNLQRAIYGSYRPSKFPARESGMIQ